MPSNLISAFIGRAFKVEKMPNLGPVLVPQVPFAKQESNQNEGLENQKSQASVVKQQTRSNSSNIQEKTSSKDIPVGSKNTNFIVGANNGIEIIIDNINLSKGVRLIHNGQVRKELPIDPLSKTTDAFRITKSEFSKL
jgi:hypothetical protein